MYVNTTSTEEILKAIGPYAETDQGMREAIGEIESGNVPDSLKLHGGTIANLIFGMGGHHNQAGHFGIPVLPCRSRHYKSLCSQAQLAAGVAESEVAIRKPERLCAR